MTDNFFSPKTIAGEVAVYHTDGKNIDITVKDTYGLISGFHVEKAINMIVDGTAGTFTVKVTGVYKFDGVASLFPSGGMLLHFAAFVNDVIELGIETGIDFKNSQNMQTFSGTGLLTLVAGDVVSVKGRSDTVPVTVNIHHMNLNLFRVGP